MPDDTPVKPSDAEQPGRSYAALLSEPSGADDGPPVADDAGVAPPSPLRIIEALLFIGGAPLTAVRACEIIRGLTPEQFAQVIDELTTAYRRQARPYAVQPRG